jgi:hypothetical protein
MRGLFGNISEHISNVARKFLWDLKIDADLNLAKR